MILLSLKRKMGVSEPFLQVNIYAEAYVEVVTMEPVCSSCDRCEHALCTRRVPVFASLTDEEQAGVTSLVIRKRYAKGEVIYLEGDQLDGMMILHQGRVKAYRYTPEGKEQILYIFSPGDFFGEKNLLRTRRASYHAEALEDTRICLIRKDDFQQLVQVHPPIAQKVMEELCVRLERLETLVQSMGTKNAEARVSMVLLELASKYGKPGPRGIVITLPLSREGIASYIGVTRETVSRKLGLLQDEGIIAVEGNKKVIILNEEALQRSL